MQLFDEEAKTPRRSNSGKAKGTGFTGRISTAPTRKHQRSQHHRDAPGNSHANPHRSQYAKASRYRTTFNLR